MKEKTSLPLVLLVSLFLVPSLASAMPGSDSLPYSAKHLVTGHAERDLGVQILHKGACEPDFEGPCLGWAHTDDIGVDTYETIHGSTYSTDGSTLYLVGQHRSDPYPADVDLLVQAIDTTTGTELWTWVHGIDEDQDERGHGVTTIADDSALLLTGGRQTSTGGYAFTMRLDLATLTVAWLTDYTDWAAETIELSPSGEVAYLEGYSTVHAVRLSDGTLLWSHEFGQGTARTDDVLDMALSPDGGTLALAGAQQYGVNGYIYTQDWLVEAIDVNDGDLVWSHLVDFSPPDDDLFEEARTVDWTPDGRTVLATGLAEPAGPGAYHLMRAGLDASTGDPRFVVVDGEKWLWQPEVSTVSPDGLLLYVALESSSSTVWEVHALSTRTGERVWRHLSDHGYRGSPREPLGLGLDTNGTVLYLASSSYHADTGEDVAVLGIDTMIGERLFLETWSSLGRATDWGRTASFHPNGSAVAIGGISYGGGPSADVMAIQFEAPQ